MLGSMLGGSWTAGMMMHFVLYAHLPGMGSLIGHLLYGSLLGVIASAPEPRLAHA